MLCQAKHTEMPVQYLTSATPSADGGIEIELVPIIRHGPIGGAGLEMMVHFASKPVSVKQL